MTTLKQALKSLAPNNLCILSEKPEIGDLPIANFDNFCRYPIRNYLSSITFIYHFDECKDDYAEALDLGKEPFLFLFRTSDTSIYLRIAYGEPESAPKQ